MVKLGLKRVVAAAWILAVVSVLMGLDSLIGRPFQLGLWPFAFLALGSVAIAWMVARESESSSLALQRAREQARALESQNIEQKAAIDSLADGLEVALFICDREAIVQYANRPAAEMFEFESSLNRPILAVTFADELEDLIREAVETREPRSDEIVLPYPEPRVARAKAWLSNSDQVYATLIDITDLKKLMRVRQDFVANVSHELRTPMTIIRAMSETMLDDMKEPDETAERYLGRIISEVDRLTHITDDLLILSAAEAQTPERVDCDIAEIYRTVVEEWGAPAKAKGLKLVYSGPESLVIEANPTQMRQVAINLVQNALNYTPKGSVDVRLSPAGNRVVIEVADTGIGISSEQQLRIFERFYRVDKARSRSTGGTGLGLSIVRHIAESHGGTATVKSALNQGSTFTVVLPMRSV
jgi:two-component system phosphate regulon sensor histidine kinase PhoR